MRARCVRKVAHPAPEIELESCDANADRVAGIGDRTHFGNANRRTWRAAASHIAVGAERRQPFEIGRAHVRTPVTNAHLVCRLLLEKKKHIHKHNYITHTPYTNIHPTSTRHL